MGGLLFHPLALKIYLVLFTLLTGYTVYLDATIRSSFEGKKWQLPARVYARPLELYAGLPVSANEFEQELKDLGYQNGTSTRPGSYFRSGEQFTLHTRGHTFWDGIEVPQSVQLAFNGKQLKRLGQLNGASLALLRLEPMEIGAIYPNHREDRILVKIEDVPPLLVAALLRSLRRKFTEAIMALLLDRRYSKEAILQAYLNEVYLGQAGARAIHGFGLASQHYFNRPLHELSVDRLAMLIAIVRGPTYYDPWRHPQRTLARRNLVIDALQAQQLLGSEDAQWAKQQALQLGKQTRSHFVFPAYIDLVKRQLRDVYQESDLTSNGLKIYTSFDPRIQRYAEQAVIDWLGKTNSTNMQQEALQAAVVVTQPETGEVLALVGGTNPRFAGFNRALDARRSIGSVVKPVVYLSALAKPKRYTLASLVDDSAITIDVDGVQWSPRNYDRKDHGEVPLVTAMAKSYNQATARLGNELGVTEVVDLLQAMGIERKLNAVPSLFIGATQLSPFEVAGLYQTIAANGYRTPLKAIRAVLDNQNLPLERFQYQISQSVDADSMHLIQSAMVHVGRQGSAQSARYALGNNFTFAGKTGTSGDQRDSWFAGFTGDLLAVVWLGHDNNKPTPYTGSTGALPIWTQLIASASRRPLLLMPGPSIETAWIDLASGQRVKRSCRSAVELPFIMGSTPKTIASCSQ
jgi:penicillin-binding protein 1B